VRAPDPPPPPPPPAAAADAAAAPALRAIVASHRAAFRERAGAAGAERPAASQDGAGPAAVAAAFLQARDAGALWRAGAPVSAGQHARGVGSDSDALRNDTAEGRGGEAGGGAHAAEDLGRSGVERASSAQEAADGPRGGPPRRRRRLQAGGEPAAAQAAAAGCAHSPALVCMLNHAPCAVGPQAEPRLHTMASCTGVLWDGGMDGLCRTAHRRGSASPGTEAAWGSPMLSERGEGEEEGGPDDDEDEVCASLSAAHSRGCAHAAVAILRESRLLREGSCLGVLEVDGVGHKSSLQARMH